MPFILLRKIICGGREREKIAFQWNMNKRKRQRESSSRDVKFLKYLHIWKDNLLFDVVESGSRFSRVKYFKYQNLNLGDGNVIQMD